ncbi:hypothetical protein VFSR5_A0617 [Aliivibrio fischeri SR5]|uniref:Uncharacterized protein n=1 Tax=Aliivibrio fischeri SR5 TaxID=1088719 RepID=A0AAV3EM55_ALIFS|nr:hypothetical protein VFSR5_A0617 [Aliivibrio fischeri SR5]
MQALCTIKVRNFVESIIVQILLVVLGWLAIPSIFFFVLFLIIWLILKLNNNELVLDRYSILTLRHPLRGLWISMASFMEERAFLKLKNGVLKSVLRLIYPLYSFWDRTLILSIVVLFILTGWFCFLQ